MKSRARNPEETRDRLIQAAVALILRQGFPATTVDQICAESGLTKGAFFHHFPDKDALGMAVITWWGNMGYSVYSPAWESQGDPLEALFLFLDIMSGFTLRDQPCTCIVGIISQEMSLAHPAFQARCAEELTRWSDHTTRLLEAAKQAHPPAIDFDPESVAWFLNSIWQGSMLIGKTLESPELIRSNLELARQLLRSFFPGTSFLFPSTPPNPTKTPRKP